MKPERMLPLLYSRLLSSVRTLLLIGILVFAASPAMAGWSPLGVFAALQALQADHTVAAPDGQGGTVMAWDVNDNGDYSVHAGRVDAEGNRLWGDEGIAIAHFANLQLFPAIATDAAGNSYIAWRDTRAPSGIRVQKVAPDGAFLWDPNGVVVAGLGTGSDQQLVADESGGCYIVWHEDRFGNNDVFIQRLNSSGNPYFAANGFQIVADPQSQVNPVIILDGAGGVIVAWEDLRNSFNFDVYAQSFNFFNSPVWGANGTAIATTSNDDDTPALVTDGAAGAIVIYESEDDIYANRISAGGSLQWGSGIIVSLEVNTQSWPEAISDGAGGAIAVWADTRDPLETDTYAQRIAPNGAVLWHRGGLLLCNAPDDQWLPKVASDGAGGAIAIWNDSRPTDNAIYFYTQRITPDGVLMWGAGGRGVLVATEPRVNTAVFPDGNGNAILAGEDHRTGGKPVTQRIDGRHGYWGRPEPIISSVSDTPGDQGGYVSVNWLASERDQLSENLITHYSVWRATDAVPALVYGEKPQIVKLEDMRPGFDGPAFRAAERALPGAAGKADGTSPGEAPGEFFWEYVGEQEALFASGYSFNAPTKSDSVGGDPATHYFQVVAHTSSQFISWPSVEASGSSVDNLAPAAPLLLSAQRLGGDDVLLEWSPGALEGDLSDYAVYRAGASGVIPDPLFFLSDEADTTGIDSTATASSAFYYIVTARDIHGNESTPSNEAMVTGSPTGIGDRTPALTTLRVLPNVPNPYSAITTLRFELPEASSVTLEVFDVRGRRVFAGNAGRMSAGEQALVFDGHGQEGAMLPSGVYFYRVSAAGLTQTRKMVISR